MARISKCALALIGACALVAAVIVAFSPVRANGVACGATAVHAGPLSVNAAVNINPPAQAAPLIRACISARQHNQHLSVALGAAGIVLATASLLVRPRMRIDSAIIS
jgi:hypothetical protein